ncbi:MAG: hypothetical protein ABSE58_07795 [Candidatus Limnocylindrales bacterium]|jgi:hypothetical protein
MRIPDVIRKSVGFVGFCDQDGREVFSGTFFFVYVPMSDTYSCAYAVTARHVIAGMQSVRIPQPMLRLNLQDETANAVWVSTEYSEWVLSERVEDTAILRVSLGLSPYDYQAMSVKMALTAERIREFEIGPGTDVFIPGLFLMFDDPRRVYGVNRNVPIIRAGHIAAMTGELVPTEVGKMDAYLVEARSIGGLSGSPVFAHMGSVRVEHGVVKTAKGPEGEPFDHGIFYLMGLVHGHFPMLPYDDEPSRGGHLDAGIGAKERDVNMGISIVVPIERLTALLDREDVRTAREAEYASWLARPVVTPALSEPPPLAAEPS